MDLFKSASNWFRGAFGGDDEEKKKKKQQQTQQKPKPTPVKPTSLLGQKDKTLDTLGLNPKGANQKPTKEVQPTVPRLAVPQFNQKFDFSETEGRKMNDSFKQGKINRQQYELYTKQAADYAKKNMTNGKVTAGNIAGAVKDTAVDLLQGTARVPETVLRSVAQPLADNLNKSASQKEKNTGLRKFFYGEDAVKTYADQARDIGETAKKSDSKITRDVAPYAIFLAPALAALDLSPSGKTKGEALEIGTKELARIVTEQEAKLGRKLSNDEIKDEANKIITETAKAGGQSATKTDGVNTDRTQRNNQREMDAALEKNAAQGKVDNTPAYERQIEGTAETPAPEKPAFQHRQEIEAVVKAETENFNRYINEHPDLTPQQLEAAQQAAKDRIIKLTDELKANREATLKAVDEAGTKTADDVAAQQKIVEEVRTAKQEADAPVNVAANPATAAETVANDGYRPTTEEILFPNAPEAKVREDLSLPQLLSPDRVIRENITRPLENVTDKIIGKAQTSDNKLARGIGRMFTGFSREIGVTPEQQTAKMGLRGGVETGKLYRETIADLSKGMKPESTDRIWASLDPEFAARKGMEAPNLNDTEIVLRDKLKNIIDNTTSENLRRGLITPEQAAAGSYIKRSYSVFDGNTEASKFEAGFRQELLGQYKGRKEVSDEMVDLAITDPTYLVGKKAAESNAMWAMQDYGNFLVKNGDAVDVGKPGYTKLPESPVFGEAAGKWVPRNTAEDFTGFQYSNALASAFNDVINVYDRWNVRQAKKQILTIFNPAVRAGNQITNRGIFSNLNGINPLQFNAKYLQVNEMIAQGHPLYREAVERGLTGIDITQADFFAQRIAQSAGEDKNMFKKAIEWTQTSYSGADDKARIAAYAVHRERGYSPEEAARMTQRGFQDYKSVGFFYDMAAKTPLIGNAFVRFAADSVRIAKNTAVDHPMRALGTIAAWTAFVNGMSVLSGESEAKGDNVAEQGLSLLTGESKSEEQKARENRFGSPKLPFTDISTSVQTPWGEVNAARFMPWYSLNEIGAEGSKFLPFSQSPVVLNEDKNGVEANAGGFQDPLLGQFVQMAMDKDFRGKSIQDPENTGQLNRDPLSTEEKLKNIGRFFGVGNAPLGKEIDALYSAATGQEDIYGKDRSLLQAGLRAAGIKVEQYGKEQLQDNADTKAYFDELKGIEEELKGMSPDAQAAYKRLTGYDKMREKVPNEFEPGSERYKKAPVYDFGEDKWKDYAAHPEIYKLMVEKKQREAAEGKPLQPEFDPRLSEGFRKQLIQNKMVAPGDDAELDQRMYSAPEWDYYQSLKKAYKDKAKEYFPDNGDDFTDELVKHQDAKFPEKPDTLKAYGAAFAAYTAGKATKPEFTDQVKAAKEAYNKQTFDWTNTERAARGLPAINWDVWNNPTFGFDSTPSASGFGFGFGGGGKQEVNTLGELTNFSNDIKRYEDIDPAAMPQIMQLFAKLKAGQGGGRQKPRLGASSRGQ